MYRLRLPAVLTCDFREKISGIRLSPREMGSTSVIDNSRLWTLNLPCVSLCRWGIREGSGLLGET